MEKIRATMILEVLGRPPEHLTIALNNMIEKIGEEKGLEILETIKNEPKELEDHKDLYTTFAEVTFEVESILHYFGIIFAYMPSNIEIISPDHIDFSNYDLSDLSNRLALRLHDYDAIAKKAMAENQMIKRKLEVEAPHLLNTPAPSPQPPKTEDKPEEDSWG